MSNIYLSRIYIRDFRTFGHFEIDIPAMPGLVLLTGTNGLGKSSFFDAIEWSLTGKVRRFTPYVEKKGFPEGSYLTRRGAEPDSHEVILTFSDQTSIERSNARATPTALIVSHLARTDHPAIDDLGTYLALTHFLGQAAQQRFTSRDSQDQWQALKGPSGIERLEQVRSGLRGRATISAFTRRIESEQSAVADIEKKIAEWQGWQVRLERLRQAARAVGSLTSDEVVLRAVALEAELSYLLKENATSIVGETSSQRLARLGERISQALQASAEREATVKGLVDAIGQFITAKVNARTDHPVLVQTRRDVANVQAELVAALPRFEAADSAVATQTKVIGAIDLNIAIHEAVRSDLARRDGLTVQIDATQTDLSSLSTVITERRTLLAAAEATVRQHADAASEVARLRKVLQRARDLVKSHATLVELEAASADDAALLAAAQHTASAAKLALEPVEVKSRSLDEQIKQATLAQAEAQRHANAISAAVATIASHVHSDDTNCPVCRTPFDIGQLKLLVTEAAQSGDTRLAAAAIELERLRTNSAILKVQLDHLRAAIDAPSSLMLAWEASRDKASSMRIALVLELSVDVSAELGDITGDGEKIALNALVEAESKLTTLAAPAAASAQQRISLAADLEALCGRESLGLLHLSTLRSEDRDCVERITARGMAGTSSEAISTLLSSQRASLEAARTQLAILSRGKAAERSQLEAIRSNLAATQRVLAENEDVRANAEAAEKQVAQRWANSGIQGVPSQAALDEILNALLDRIFALRQLGDRRQELAGNNQDVLLQEEIEEVVRAMRAAVGEAGPSDPAIYLAELHAKEGVARAVLKLTKDTRTAVTSFTELLKERAEGFSSSVLAPLNEVIDDFNCAMLSTPGESIQFKAQHRVDATSFGMSLRYRDQVTEAIERQKELPPQVVLSEGQLAANGFSILCAAGTAYPWSRWRALLLDDPLQHNDIIHTAAFVDVMRNMVELQGYQLIMSSHDRAESDFIMRKFDAAGLACSKVVLTAPSDKGVVYEEPEHNQAAKRSIERLRDINQISF